MTLTYPSTDRGIPSLHWQDFLDSFKWYQGEHMTLIGPTKSGKTTLVRELLHKADIELTHPWQAIIATKEMDEVLDTFTPHGFQTVPSWDVADPEITPKVIVYPRLRTLEQEDKEEQRKVIRHALNKMYKQHGWLIYLDELKRVVGTKALNLEGLVEDLWHGSRSAGITVVSSVQRPRHVPLMAYDQAEHLFFWESRDHNIRDRLSEIGGKADPELVHYAVSSLGDHEFLYVSPTTGRITKSKVQL